jgi:HEAT repeats
MIAGHPRHRRCAASQVYDANLCDGGTAQLDLACEGMAGRLLQGLAVLSLAALLLASPMTGVQAQQADFAGARKGMVQPGSRGGETVGSTAKASMDNTAAASSDAVGDLTRQLRGGKFRARQSAALQRVLADPEVKTAAVPALVEMLGGDDDAGVAAADALAEFGAAAVPAIPALKQITSARPGGPLRDAASRALARITAAAERARYQIRYADDLLSVKADQALLKGVMKEISQQVHIAVEVSDEVGARRISAELANRPLADGLRELLAEYDVFTYSRGGRGLLTVWVYGKLEGRGLYPVPFKEWASTADLQRRLHDYDPEVRAETLEFLVQRGRTSAAQQVVDALDDADERVRMTALSQALGEGIALPSEKLSDLALNDSWHVVRFLALKALTAGSPESWSANAEWVAQSMLGDPNPSIGRYAETVLERLHPPPPPARTGQRAQNSRSSTTQRR